MNKELLHEAASVLVPFSVKLRSLEVHMDEGYDPDLSPDRDFEIFFRFKALEHKVYACEDPEKTLIKIYAASGVRLVSADKKSPGDYDVEISANFIATYGVVGDKVPSDDALEEFGRHNSPLHIWPYWRELINNMGDRFGFGQIVLPMYRVRDDSKVGAKKDPVKKKAASKRNSEK